MLVYLTCWHSWADMSMYLTCRRIWHVDIFDMLTYMSWHVNVPELTCWQSGSCTPWGLAWSMCSLPWMFFRFPRDRPPLLGWRIGRGQSPDTGSGPCPRWERSAWRTAHCKEEGRNITYTVYVLVLNKLCWSQSKGLLTFEKKKNKLKQQYMEAAMPSFGWWSIYAWQHINPNSIWRQQSAVPYFCWYFQPVLSFSSQWTQVLPLGST